MFVEVDPVARTATSSASAVRMDFRRLLAAKEVRDNRRWMTMDVARATGVSRQTVSSYLNGRVRVVNLDYLGALCRFLECEPGELLVLAGEQEDG
jgi:putative transcriptional regulator